ncbi:MAG: hypothetical protein ACRDIX_04905 [Actinomycetota bacterium]
MLAADSRVTLTAQRVDSNILLPAFFDNATKLLKVEGQDFVAAITYGLGALGQTAPRTASSFLPEFETELKKANASRLSVEEFATKLGEFFKRQWDAAGMPPESSDQMIFLIGGYDEGAPYGRVFEVNVPLAIKPAEKNPGDSFGVIWGGQLQTATRLLNGFDPQLPKVVQEYLGLGPERQADIRQHLMENLGLPIPYQFLPLQDCIDLAILLVRTTAQLQTFMVDIRGVGGDIDVATITRTRGFHAVQQKEIRGEQFEF